jgi:AhpD family alkylhydroperoxidase
MTRTTLLAALVLAATPTFADDVADARADIAATLGGVPSFIDSVAAPALPGLWQSTKALQFSPDTALDMKTKALVSLAVSAQIPCSYCIWMDTNSARAAGATDQEIAEAVALAAQTRAWSTIFHGMQVDFESFKAELGG